MPSGASTGRCTRSAAAASSGRRRASVDGARCISRPSDGTPGENATSSSATSRTDRSHRAGNERLGRRPPLVVVNLEVHPDAVIRIATSRPVACVPYRRPERNAIVFGNGWSPSSPRSKATRVVAGSRLRWSCSSHWTSCAELDFVNDEGHFGTARSLVTPRPLPRPIPALGHRGVVRSWSCRRRHARAATTRASSSSTCRPRATHRDPRPRPGTRTRDRGPGERSRVLPGSRQDCRPRTPRRESTRSASAAPHIGTTSNVRAA